MKIELFDEHDTEILRNLEYEPDSKPGFDDYRSCLIWDDEYSMKLSSHGHELIYDLWVARDHIHQNIPFSDRVLGGEYYEKLWNDAIDKGVEWNGFKRLELSDEDKEYLDASLKRASNTDAL